MILAQLWHGIHLIYLVYLAYQRAKKPVISSSRRINPHLQLSTKCDMAETMIKA